MFEKFHKSQFRVQSSFSISVGGILERVMEKLKLATKTFLLSTILFVMLSGKSKGSPLTIPLR